MRWKITIEKDNLEDNLKDNLEKLRTEANDCYDDLDGVVSKRLAEYTTEAEAASLAATSGPELELKQHICNLVDGNCVLLEKIKKIRDLIPYIWNKLAEILQCAEEAITSLSQPTGGEINLVNEAEDTEDISQLTKEDATENTIPNAQSNFFKIEDIILDTGCAILLAIDAPLSCYGNISAVSAKDYWKTDAEKTAAE
jgi:hypothetical protein